MKLLEKTYDWNNEDLVSQYDTLPLWSSYFGHILLDNIPLKNYDRYLDVGCGTGFPLIEMCQRIGNNCKGYGIDPWKRALERIQKKISALNMDNIQVIERPASFIPFDDGYFDLITCNLGINNFDEPEKVMSECLRVLKPQGVMGITSNLAGTFNEFYMIFEKTLIEMELSKYLDTLKMHINHRGTVDSVSKLLNNAGFIIDKKVESSFSMRFLNGSAFLNSDLIISGFSDPWRKMFSKDDLLPFFMQLENNLNKFSEKTGEFKVTIPVLYLGCTTRTD